jgi:hypothetical protein
MALRKSEVYIARGKSTGKEKQVRKNTVSQVYFALDETLHIVQNF